MAHFVEVPEYGEVEFPDTMSDEDIASAVKNIVSKQSKGGEPNEDQKPSQPEANSDRNARREANEQVTPVGSQAQLQANVLVRPEDQGQRERNDQARLTNEGQTENAQGGTQGPQAGQVLGSQVPAGNQEEVITGSVPPAPKGFVEKVKEDPRSAIVAGLATAAEAGIPMLAGSVAAKVLTPLATTASAPVAGPAAPLVGLGAGLTGFAATAEVTKRIIKETERALGISTAIEEAQAKQPEVTKGVEIGTMAPFFIQSGAGLIKAGQKGVEEAVIKGGSVAAGAAKEVGKRLAAGGAAGTLYEGAIRYPVEKGIQMVAGGEEPQKPSVGSTAQSALMMAALSGAGEEVIRNAGLPETAEVAGAVAPDQAIVKKFEEAPAKPITLEPITPEAPPLAQGEAAPSLPKEETQPPVSVAGEVPAVEPTAEERKTIKLTEEKTSSESNDFIDSIEEKTYENPLDPSERVFDDESGIQIEKDGKNNIRISSIRSFEKGTGAGTRALNAIKEIADENNVNLIVDAKPFGKSGLTKSQLIDWYSRNGFVEREDGSMIRTPKPAEATAEAQPTIPSETKVKETSGIPPIEGKPPITETAVKAEEGVAQREGEGKEEVAVPEGARIAAAAYLAPDGNTYEGSSHLDAMEKAKEAGAITQAEIDAKQTAESRNTEEFGYAITLPDGTRTTTTREFGGKIAKESGQAKVEEYQFGDKAHSNEMTKDDYPETGAKEVPPTGAAKEIPPVPEGGETVMRGVSERIAESKETTPSQKYFIEADELVKRKVLPDEVADEWVESVPSEYLQETFDKAMGSIGSDEKLSRLRVRLGARLSSEKFAKGDDAGGAEVINRIAQTASDAASVLRSVQFLYKTSPKGFVKVAELLADKAGVKLKPVSTNKIQELANDFLGKKKTHEEITRKVQNATTKKEFRDALREMRKAQSEALKSQNKLFGYVDSVLPKSFSQEVYPSLLKGNLLTPISLATNIQANALRTLVDIPAMSIGSGVDTARSLLTGKPREFLFGPAEIIEYFKTLAKESPSAVKNAVKSLTGQELDIGKVTDKAEIKRRLSPLSAIKRLVSSDKTRLYEGEYTMGNRAADFAEATFGVPANVMFDLLAVGDKPFREASKRMTASSIARQIGLKGLDYQKFIELPEQGIKEYAKRVGKDAADSAKIKNDLTQELRKEASRGVFEQENKVADVINQGLNKLDNIPVVNVVARATIPYVKTPLNVIDELMQYTVWPYTFAKTFNAIKKGNTKEAQQLIGKATIGMIGSYAGAYLYKQGVLSAPADPRSKEQELGYATMPSGSINLSGIERLTKGESGLPQAGDKIVRADKLGVMGGILITSAIRSKKEDESKLMGEDQSYMAKLVNETTSIIPKVLSFSLNQTFLKGSNDLLQSLIRGEGDKWMKGVFGAASSAFIPNSLSAISRATREYMPDVQDDSFYKSMENTIRDRFGFAGATKDILPRVDFWGRDVKQTPEGADPILYNFLDMSKSRDIPNDPVSLELLHLFYTTGNKELIPSTPQKTYTIKNKTYGLTPDEFYNYSTTIGQNRYNQVQRLVSSPSYLKMTDERKMEAFKRALARGSSIGKKQFEKEIKQSGGLQGEVKKLSPKEQAQRVKELRDEQNAEMDIDFNQ